MSDNQLNEGGATMMQWLNGLPAIVQNFFAVIIAMICLVPMMAATGIDDKLFPDTAISDLRKEISGMRADLREQVKDIENLVNGNGKTLAVIQSQMVRQDEDLDALRLDIDDLQERMGRVEVRSGFLPRRKPD